MYSLKDVMKVSAVGVILLSALAACNSKPESNPTPPPSGDDRVEVIIEQVVDGKVVDTRAVGRTDVVKYTGKTDGEDVAQIGWPDDVNCDKPFDFTFYAKPGLKLIAGGYRFSQDESPLMTDINENTFGQKELLKKAGTKVHCTPNGNKKIYVRLDYKNVNNPNKESDYSWAMTLVSHLKKVSHYRGYKTDCYRALFEIRLTALKDNPERPLLDAVRMFLNPKSGGNPFVIVGLPAIKDVCPKVQSYLTPGYYRMKEITFPYVSKKGETASYFFELKADQYPLYKEMYYGGYIVERQYSSVSQWSDIVDQEMEKGVGLGLINYWDMFTPDNAFVYDLMQDMPTKFKRKQVRRQVFQAGFGYIDPKGENNPLDFVRYYYNQ